MEKTLFEQWATNISYTTTPDRIDLICWLGSYELARMLNNADRS